MMALDVNPTGHKPKSHPNQRGYTVKASTDRKYTYIIFNKISFLNIFIAEGTYFEGRCADIFLDDKKIGVFGVLHPNVLKNFKLDYPTSSLTLELEPFLS